MGIAGALLQAGLGAPTASQFFCSSPWPCVDIDLKQRWLRHQEVPQLKPVVFGRQALGCTFGYEQSKMRS